METMLFEIVVMQNAKLTENISNLKHLGQTLVVKPWNKAFDACSQRRRSEESTEDSTTSSISLDN